MTINQELLDFEQDLYKVEQFIQSDQYEKLYEYKNINIPILLNFNYRRGKVQITDPKLMTHILCNSDGKGIDKIVPGNDVTMFNGYINNRVKTNDYKNAIYILLLVLQDYLNNFNYGTYYYPIINSISTMQPQRIVTYLEKYKNQNKNNNNDDNTVDVLEDTSYRKVTTGLKKIMVRICENMVKIIHYYNGYMADLKIKPYDELRIICGMIQGISTFDNDLSSNILLEISDKIFSKHENFRCIEMEKSIRQIFVKHNLTILEYPDVTAKLTKTCCIS